ncbi:hypothetical protein [Stenotrophomonas sp. AB1(2024)]|uniref:hypothetical protein n=1 Tax=Stenotrophomonas sp. AB1(2024) TaxID=3132215 RepID=UPI0030AD8E57
MNIESPTGSTLRPWVPVYREGAVHRPAADRSAVDPPPSYDEVMGTASRVPPVLPLSGVTPLQVANETPSWRSRLSSWAAPHPLAQERKMQKLLERRERTQRKLDVACDDLERLQLDHIFRSASLRNVCGGGLFDDEGCVVVALAQDRVAHYRHKKDMLQSELVAMLDRRSVQAVP